MSDLQRIYPTTTQMILALICVGGCILFLFIIPFYAPQFFMPSKESIFSRIDESCCCPFQKARFFKCMKRRLKNRKEVTTTSKVSVTTGCEWSCPFDGCLLAFAPPLPFRRNRKKPRELRITTQNNDENSKDKKKGDTPFVAVIDGISSRNTDDRPSTLSTGQDLSTVSGSIGTADPCESSTSVPATSSVLIAQTQNLMPWTNSSARGNSGAFRTSLLDLARMQQWPALILHCSRRQCKRQDSDGLYPLHWACSGGAPVEAVQALLMAYPRAARKASYQGSTALHFACHYGSSSAVVDVLLKAYPGAARKEDRLGRTPLFHAIYKGSNMDVLRLVVEADPKAVLKTLPTSGRTPLYFAWASVLRDGRYRTRNAAKNKKWNKAVYLLEIAHQESACHDSQWTRNTAFGPATILPAVIWLLPYLPQGALELVIHTCPQELKEADKASGRLPLSLAASEVEPRCADQVIKVLLDAHPDAATRRDCQGKSALAFALRSGKLWDEGVGRLVKAAPESVGWVDHDLSLPPVALAALDHPLICRNQESHEEGGATEAPQGALNGVFHVRGGTELSEKLLQKPLSSNHNSYPRQKETPTTMDPELSRIDTIYQLLQCNPAILKARSN